MQAHWEQMHTAAPPDQTGWWEAMPEVSLRLVQQCALQPDDLIVDAGSGASTFIENLLRQGFRNLVAIDISASALESLRARLSPADRGRVRTIVDDLAQPHEAASLRDVALWHDRAALHFLVEPADCEVYASLVHAAVRPGGFVILAAFAVGGADECSGLPVTNYNASMLSELLGPDFALVEATDHVYINRDGDPRPYVYTLFQRSIPAGV